MGGKQSKCDAAPEFIKAGASEAFSFDDLVWFPGKDTGKKFEDVDLANIDVIVGGPHSSAIYAAELQPFVSKDLTRRQQFDFSDVSTAAVAREWVQADHGKVIFVENPHSRLLFDPNRQDMSVHNAEFEEFKQMKTYSSTKPPSEDAPNEPGPAWSFFKASTFGGAAVLDVAKLQAGDQAQQEKSFQDLVAAMSIAKKGPEKYEECLRKVVGAVCAAKQKSDQKVLDVVSLHDTSNFKCFDNGSITKERPAEDLLPLLASFDGPMVGKEEDGTNRSPAEGNRINQIAAAWAEAFGTEAGKKIAASKEAKDAARQKFTPDADIKFCVPYNGANESKQVYQEVSDGVDLYVYQVEFEREVLMGTKATKTCRTSGKHWPQVEKEHIQAVAKKLAAANALLRTQGDCYSAPEFIKAGSSEAFSFEDLVWFPGKDTGKKFEDLDLANIDVIVGGPHSSAIYAAELQPFVSRDLTRRQQFDFSDVSTAAVAREWVQADHGKVIFVENPHSRLLFDPNRQDMSVHNAEFEEFKKMKTYSSTKPPSEDAPNEPGPAWSFFKASTFGGAAVLDVAKLQEGDQAQQEKSFQDLVAAMSIAKKGPEKYEECLRKVVGAVCAAKQTSDQKALDVISLHDTSNFKCFENGSITKKRPAEDLLPSLASFDGPMVGNAEDGTNRSPAEGNRIHKIATAWAEAFGTETGKKIAASKEAKDAACQKFAADADIMFCVPYNGANESKQVYKELSEGVDLYVYQVEFEREVLMGTTATETCRTPGTNWPQVEREHIQAVAKKLATADALLRTY